jgi:ubiquinone biosynthesis protein
LGRTVQIAKVLSKYGLDWLAHSDSPLSVVALPKKFSHEDRTQAERVRLALEELGTTYIKLGQAISTRTDLVPQDYVQELAKLQDAAPEIPFSDVRNMIISELGCPPEALFSEFDRAPLAAASIGQVHRARLEDGSRVVVKVQRPGVEERVDKDLDVLQEVIDLLNRSDKLRNYNLQDWLDEFSFTLRNELDYRREGRNAEQFQRNFQDESNLQIPRVFWEYTSRRVLTMEEVGGIKITDVEALDRGGIDRKVLAKECARLVFREIFEFGFFHADPHAGNFFVQCDGRINLVDFGMVGRLDRADRESLMRITRAMADEDAETLLDELLNIGNARRPVDRTDLKRDLQHLITLHLDAPPEEFSLAQTFQDTLKVAAEHYVLIPSNMLFLARALAMAEGLGRVLDPTYRMMDTVRPEMERIYREQRSPEALAERAKENYLEVGEIALDFPKRARRLMGQLERGELVFTTRLADTPVLLDNMHRVFNRLSMSVLTAGIVAGLSVLSLQIGSGWKLWIVDAMLAIVIGAGIVLLASFWRSRHTA